MHGRACNFYKKRGERILGGYLVSVIMVSSLVALATYFSYGSTESRAVKVAMSIIVLYTVASPIVTAIDGFSDISFDGVIDIEDIVGIGDTECAEVAEDAFCDGIRAAVAERYGLNIEEIRARVSGFDFERMRAERVTVILSGNAAFSDHRAIAEYITEAGLGECEVKIEIG